ncbi:polysaccharide deacetylase family protein [Bordetella sp. BOR01]|uniref:polysaccharide deacetylase family protein n=1 Tax=Bordetella sp. BOR01 TaxID=2854779 RepID=UPI001C46A2CA|nr:polysaccharide deacetylase family protein [Bordetella sp. BOR01]MBV7483183.1 polysaccharide deacetylase family protein [Bordetella sp. BOR01]
MTTLQRGMDHDLYTFCPMPARAALNWPDGKPLALWVVLYLDYWELDTPQNMHRAPGTQGLWGHQFPDLRTFSYRLYGERIGVFRILDTLARHGVRATVAAGAEICQRYPELVRACAEQGHEIAAHGTHATRMITSRMSEAEELSIIQQARDAVTQACGIAPAGWFGQDHGESTRTPRLISDAGFDYLADWPNDEQPYWLTLPNPIVSLPLQVELDDQQLLWMRQQPAWRYPELVEHAANQLAADGRGNGRSLGLGLRSWLFGRPHRIRYLDDALSRLVHRKDIWYATAGEVANAFRNALPYPGDQTP